MTMRLDSVVMLTMPSGVRLCGLRWCRCRCCCACGHRAKSVATLRNIVSTCAVKKGVKAKGGVKTSCGVATQGAATVSSVEASRRIFPGRISACCCIVAGPRRRTQLSLKANGHVVHIDVADGVLAAESVLTDGYRLVAFDVFAKGIASYGDVTGACCIATHCAQTNGHIVDAGGVRKKRAASKSGIKLACGVAAEGVGASGGVVKARRIQPQRTSPNSRIVRTRRRTKLSLKANCDVVHVDVADRVLIAEGVYADCC
jgi:hypothetical protein